MHIDKPRPIVSVHARLTATDPEIILKSDKGLPFFLRNITYSGGDTFAARGPAKLTDGSVGLIDRTCWGHLMDLPYDMQDALKNERYEAVKRLMDKTEPAPTRNLDESKQIFYPANLGQIVPGMASMEAKS